MLPAVRSLRWGGSSVGAVRLHEQIARLMCIWRPVLHGISTYIASLHNPKNVRVVGGRRSERLDLYQLRQEHVGQLLEVFHGACRWQHSTDDFNTAISTATSVKVITEVTFLVCYKGPYEGRALSQRSNRQPCPDPSDHLAERPLYANARLPQFHQVQRCTTRSKKLRGLVKRSTTQVNASRAHPRRFPNIAPPQTYWGCSASTYR